MNTVSVVFFHSYYYLLQNEFLEKTVKQKERELNLHKAEFDVRCKVFPHLKMELFKNEYVIQCIQVK